MTQLTPKVRGPVYFCFANPAGFSGQKAATEIVIRGLTQRGWLCRLLPQPVLNRERGQRLALLLYLFGVLRAWAKAAVLLVSRGSWLCVNLGQTRAAFLRDAVPLLLGRAGLGRDRVVVSLHGSLFMQWAAGSADARLFRFLLARAGTVTVLGESQRRHLVALGVPADRVKVVVNSCDLELPTARMVEAKHARSGDANPAVHCLYLSSLIDTKGFPEYLEALDRLAADPGPRIEAVLCGRLVASEFSQRFPDATAAETWIEEQIAAINRRARIRVRWVKGATGAHKAALLHTAEIFVLPTRYAVEAQPLVLLEAMASGCAIITTRAGEIPTILDDQSAVFLAEASTGALAEALADLVADRGTRARLAGAGHERFTHRYQFERHIDAWETLLQPAREPAGGEA